MTIVKITELPAADSPVSPSDVMPVVQNGVTKKAGVNELGYLSAGTGAITRTLQNRIRDTYSAKDFGAIGDGVADDTVALTNFFNAIAGGNSSNGYGIIPAGDYRVTSPIVIAGKNSQNPSTRSVQVDAYGARFIPSGFTGIVVDIQDCKQFDLAGLTVLGSLNTNGVWYSTWRDILISGTWYFLNGPNSGFETVYWNSFINIRSAGIVWDCRNRSAKGGPPGILGEVAANAFYNCKIQGGEYAFDILGTGQCQQNAFYGGDISYYSIAFIRVNTARIGSVDLYGVYFDSPVNTAASGLNGFTVNIHHCVTANDNSFVYDTNSASKTTVDEIGGSRMRTRFPASSGNLMINGDLQTIYESRVPPGISVTNWSVSRQVDTATPNQYKQYLRATSSTAFAQLNAVSIPVPATGVYNITVVGRVSGGTGVFSIFQPGTPGELYGGINIGSDWSVSSCEFFLTANDTFTLAFGKQNDSTSVTLDIAYIGLTQGRFGQLYAPPAPLADQSVSGVWHHQWSKNINSGTEILKLDFTSDFQYSNHEIELFGSDGAYEEGNAYRKYILQVLRAGGAATPTLHSITAVHDGNLTGDISLATSVASNIVTVTATAPNGEMITRILMKSTNIPRSRILPL